MSSLACALSHSDKAKNKDPIQQKTFDERQANDFIRAANMPHCFQEKIGKIQAIIIFIQAPLPSFVSVKTGVQVTLAFLDEFVDLLAIGRLSRSRNYLFPSGVASYVTADINRKGHLKVNFSVLWWRRREFNWAVKSLFFDVLLSSLLALCPQLCPQPNGPVGDSQRGPAVTRVRAVQRSAAW